MEFVEVVRKRRMVRNFADRPVAPEAIDRIMALTWQAPSAGLTQGQSFVVVRRSETKAAIGRLCGEEEHASSEDRVRIAAASVAAPPDRRVDRVAPAR